MSSAFIPFAYMPYSISLTAEDPMRVGIHAIGSVGVVGISKDDVGTATATRFDYSRLLMGASRIS